MSLLALVPDGVWPACAATETPGLPQIGIRSSTRSIAPCDKRPGNNRVVLIGAGAAAIMAGVSAAGNDPGAPIMYTPRRPSPCPAEFCPDSRRLAFWIARSMPGCDSALELT